MIAHNTLELKTLSENCNRMLQYNITCEIQALMTQQMALKNTEFEDLYWIQVVQW
jgi:hypothetical protein